AKDFAAQLGQARKELRLSRYPLTKLRQHFLARTVLTDTERIAPSRWLQVATIAHASADVNVIWRMIHVDHEFIRHTVPHHYNESAALAGKCTLCSEYTERSA